MILEWILNPRSNYAYYLNNIRLNMIPVMGPDDGYKAGIIQEQFPRVSVLEQNTHFIAKIQVQLKETKRHV